MATNLNNYHKRNLIRLVAWKKKELDNAVTVGQYWQIQCELNKLQEQLKKYNNGCNV